MIKYIKQYKRFSYIKYNNMKNKYFIATICYTSWCGLGFIRGINSYKYDKIKEPYIYSDSIIDGLIGIFVYGNPILLPLFIHKELYRLEVNIRNLENEKKSKFYNKLI